jgi:hypothetical protein
VKAARFRYRAGSARLGEPNCARTPVLRRFVRRMAFGRPLAGVRFRGVLVPTNSGRRTARRWSRRHPRMAIDPLLREIDRRFRRQGVSGSGDIRDGNPDFPAVQAPDCGAPLIALPFERDDRIDFVIHRSFLSSLSRWRRLEPARRNDLRAESFPNRWTPSREKAGGRYAVGPFVRLPARFPVPSRSTPSLHRHS